jgi:hypothetical protein
MAPEAAYSQTSRQNRGEPEGGIITKAYTHIANYEA